MSGLAQIESNCTVTSHEHVHWLPPRTEAGESDRGRMYVERADGKWGE